MYKTIKEISDYLAEETERINKDLNDEYDRVSELSNAIDSLNMQVSDTQTMIEEILNDKIVSCSLCGIKTTEFKANTQWHTGHIWNLQTGNVRFQLRGFSRSDVHCGGSHLYPICSDCKKKYEEYDIFQKMLKKAKGDK